MTLRRLQRMRGRRKTSGRLAIGLAAAALAATSVSLAAPQRRVDERGPCDSPDRRPWLRLTAPPADADDLAAQAAKHPAFSVPQHWVAQTWFGLGDSVLLCRSDAPLGRACAGEWWRFEPKAGGGHALVDHDGFLCLAGGTPR